MAEERSLSERSSVLVVSRIEGGSAGLSASLLGGLGVELVVCCSGGSMSMSVTEDDSLLSYVSAVKSMRVLELGVSEQLRSSESGESKEWKVRLPSSVSGESEEWRIREPLRL